MSIIPDKYPINSKQLIKEGDSIKASDGYEYIIVDLGDLVQINYIYWEKSRSGKRILWVELQS